MWYVTEAATRCVLQKRLFLKISQKLQENTCIGISFLSMLQAFRNATLLKRTPTKVFFYESCAIFTSTYFKAFLLMDASNVDVVN